MFNFNLRRATYKYKTMWNYKRNPQTCYWRRASQIKQLKARGVCSLSLPLSLLRNVWFHIFFFSFAEDAVKVRELSYQKFVFNSSENRSKFYLLSRNAFTFVIILIFRLALKLFVCPRSRKHKLTHRDPRKMLLCRFVRFLNEHFCAVDLLPLTSCKQEIQ